MNWDQIEGQWKQMGAQVKAKWAKLTDDDLRGVRARKDMLIGKIQERYGVLKEDAEHQVDEWMNEIHGRQNTNPNITDDRPTTH